MAKTTSTGETRKPVLLHDQKANFWKPSKKGEKVVGKLLAIKTGKFGDSLRIQQGAEAVSVPINDFLKDVDFGSLVGHVIEIIYVESVGRGMRLFDVFDLQDGVPF